MSNNIERGNNGPQRIRGNSGTDPQGSSADTPPATLTVPAASLQRKGVLRIEEGNIFVDVGGERIWVDPVSSMRILSGTPLKVAGKLKRKNLPEELSRTVEIVQKNRAKLESIPGVVSVRAGYKFIDGKIRKIPCVVVGVLPGTAPKLPDNVDGSPVDVTTADPYELLAYNRK